jgi:hypothetical protein
VVFLRGKLGLIVTGALLLAGAPLLAGCATPASTSTTMSTTLSDSTPTGSPSAFMTSSTESAAAAWLGTTSTAPNYPPLVTVPYLDFFYGFAGDGYYAFKMDAVPEGDNWVIRVVVRVDADRETRATYDAIYDRATTSAERLGAATGENERLRIVLVEATPIPPVGKPEQKILEQRVFSLAATSPAAQEASAQAKATLLAFFQAWTAKDEAAFAALLTEDRQIGSWTFADLDHVEFGTVLAAPEGIDSYMTYGRGSLEGMDRDNVRCFRASVTFYYRPGDGGSTESGEELPWMWFLVLGADGEWRVDDWGA